MTATCRKCGRFLDLSKPTDTVFRYADGAPTSIVVTCAVCGTVNRISVEANMIAEETVTGSEPTYAEMELVNWASDVAKSSITTLNDGLRQMVTLVTAMLAGSAAFFNQIPSAGWAKGTAALFLMASLAAALLGTIRHAELNARDLEAIRRERKRGIEFKSRCLEVAAATLVLAFGVLLAGMLFH